MNNEYHFYKEYIYPLEKKLNFYMLLNNKIKLNFLKNKINNIENKIIIYYKVILTNKKYQKKIIKELSK